MNIPSSVSERAIPKLAPKIQPDTKSCKLSASESKPNLTLKKIGQQLDVAEIKCLTLKSELNCMMDVCRKEQTEAKGSKGTFDIPREQTAPLFKNSDSKSCVEHRNYVSALSAKSARFSPRGNADNDGVAKYGILKEEPLSSVAVTRTLFDKILPPAIKSLPVPNQITEIRREYESPQYSYTEIIRARLQSALNAKSSGGELISRADKITNRMDEDIRGSKLNLDVPEGTRARQPVECKYTGNEANSICKTSDAPSKIRKRKGKLRSSISKSTVATKDTYHLSRKETKKRKNRGHSVTHQQSTLLKHTRKSDDVVEIFHNTSLKSSNSRVSAKHSKVGRAAKHVKKQSLAETFNQKTKEKPHSKHVTRQHQFYNKENQRDLCPESLNLKRCPKITAVREEKKLGKHQKDLNLETLSCKSTPRQTTGDVQEENKSEKHTDKPALKVSNRESDPRVADGSEQNQHKSKMDSNDSLRDQCKTRQHEPIACGKLNDSTPNYEMPTVASKLKRSNRLYFGRFNFHNIPFVVGTSVTPSHNLGLNIQQVLSVMKTRHPSTDDIAPLLINKVNRSAKSVSTFLEQISVQYDRSIFDLKTGQLADKESSSVKQERKSSVLELQHTGKARNVNAAESSAAKTIPESDDGQFCKEKGDFCGEYKMKQRPPSLVRNRCTSIYGRNQRVSRMSSGKEDNIGDHKMRVADSHPSKEIRDVLINLHDQFDEMNTRYEKLQGEVESSDDPTLRKKLSTLEKTLHVKEEEINAVIGLYKEVMSLKQQMKMLHKKNSLVCVATESFLGQYRNPFPISFVPGKSHLTNTASILGSRRTSNVYGAARDPPASIQLTALLRQIQTFHKQITS